MDDYDLEQLQYDQYESRYADELEMVANDEEKRTEKGPSIATSNQQDKENAQHIANITNRLKVSLKDSEIENVNYGLQSPKRTLDEDLYLSEDDIEFEIRRPLKKLKASDGSSKDSPVTIQYKSTPQLLKPKPKEKRHIHRIPPMGVDVIPITNEDGDRCYAELIINEPCDKKVPDKMAWKKSGLLSTPFSRLRSGVEDKIKADAIRKMDQEASCMSSHINQDALIEGTSNRQPVAAMEKLLWVEKYTPNNYQELLSDDGTNRIILKWLKLWDGVVFGKSSNRPKKKKEIPKFNKFNNNNDTNSFKKKFVATDYEEELEVDTDGFPKLKVALLCGNPGLGKTTLAHVIARHAGYNVVEMNASDDRSPEIFKNRIENATQMKAVIGDNKRPNCLIIDEIDGAPLQTINVLLQALKVNQGNVSAKKKKTKQLVIQRPVICICNDQYVPALRQLKHVSLCVNFPETLSARLSQRLLQISKFEDMRVDMASLAILCEKTQNDIRSCLNTLQFICNEHGELRADHVKSADIGQKDFKKGLFNIWQEIFQLPKKDTYKSQHNDPFILDPLAALNAGRHLSFDKQQSSLSARFYNILHAVSSNSEYDKMIQGLFDNYLLMKSKDPHMENIVLASDWLQFSDSLSAGIRRSQSFTLMKFYAFVPVTFHLLFASALKPKLILGSSSYECHLKRTKTLNTLQSLVSDVSPATRTNLDECKAVTELLPYFYELMFPPMRPVNVQLYSENEKFILANLIEAMISYNVTYRQEKNSDGQYTYILDPNIEELVSYPGLVQHKQLSYGTKQMIAREIGLEKMRRSERVKYVEDVPTTQLSEKKQALIVKKIQPKKIFSKPEIAAQSKDFFGRVITKEQIKQKAVEKAQQEPPPLIVASLWFKFNEGYSNAVRRKVRIQDLL